MENRIARTNRGLLATKRLPGQPDSRLEGGLVHLYANSRVRGLSRNKKSACLEVEVRLAILVFRDWCYQRPSQPEIQRQIAGHAPVVLHVGAKQFPSPSRSSALEGLIVQGQIRQT